MSAPKINFSKIPERARKYLRTDWLKRGSRGVHWDFSVDLWNTADDLVDGLTDVMNKGLFAGIDLDRMTANLQRKTMLHATYIYNRVIRTETGRLLNMAHQESYVHMGVMAYEFIAKIDGKTNPRCRNANGMVIPILDGEVGVDIPPLHPNCRSTIVPVLNDERIKNNVRKRIQKAVPPKPKPTATKRKTPAKPKTKKPMSTYHMSANCPLRNEYKPGQLNKIMSQVNDAPDHIRELWERHEDDMVVVRARGVDAYFPGSRRVKMSINADTTKRGNHGKKNYSVLFHELGHLVDNQHVTGRNNVISNMRFKGTDFSEVIRKEFNEFRDTTARDLLIQKGYTTAQDQTDDLLNKACTVLLRNEPDVLTTQSYSAVSDIMNGASYGEVRPGWGHSWDYWQRDRHEVGSEAFAHFFQASIQGGDHERLAKKYFPKSYEYFHELVKEVLK